MMTPLGDCRYEPEIRYPIRFVILCIDAFGNANTKRE
jgi:hypothetical protein